VPLFGEREVDTTTDDDALSLDSSSVRAQINRILQDIKLSLTHTQPAALSSLPLPVGKFESFGTFLTFDNTAPSAAHERHRPWP
jgi:hypothetical protein